MIIRNHIYGEFTANPFVIGTNNKNDYFPIYSAFDSYENNEDNKLLEHIIDEIFLYKKPSNFCHTKTGIGRYGDLFYILSI